MKMIPEELLAKKLAKQQMINLQGRFNFFFNFFQVRFF